MGIAQIPTIETAQLRLRPLSKADVPKWAQLIYADPDVTRYLPGPDATPLERTERLYQQFSNHWQNHGYGEWAVTDRETGAFLGQCGLNHIADISETELDYALAKHAWGRGLATEAANAAVQFAFETVGLRRLIGFVIPEHIASRRVLERLGFAYECDMPYWGVDLVRYGLDSAQFGGRSTQANAREHR
jgi:RimJ/RimL family protein N-acetyltransferase